MNDTEAKDDIVSRLRREGENAMRKALSLGMHALCAEAADEIERCREIAHDEELESKALLSENRQLHEAISELRHVWWNKGIDLDKEAVAQQCLKLFSLAHGLKQQ